MARYRAKDKCTAFGRLSGHNDPMQHTITELNRDRMTTATPTESLSQYQDSFLTPPKALRHRDAAQKAYEAERRKRTGTRMMMMMGIVGLDQIYSRVSMYVIVSLASRLENAPATFIGISSI